MSAPPAAAYIEDARIVQVGKHIERLFRVFVPSRTFHGKALMDLGEDILVHCSYYMLLRFFSLYLILTNI